MAESLLSMGYILIQLRRFQESVEYLVQGVNMQQRLTPGDYSDISNILIHIGNAYKILGSPPSAFEYAKQGLEMTRRLSQDDHPLCSQAHALSIMGDASYSLGKIEEGHNLLKQSIEIGKVFPRP